MKWTEWFRPAVLVVFAGLLNVGLDCDPCSKSKYETVYKDDTLTSAKWDYELRAENANKDCHATFILVISWVNEERYLDETQKSPFWDSTDVRMEFRTPYGSFTLFQIAPQQYQVSLPGGGLGNYWKWETSAGAKNESYNPTTFIVLCVAPGLDWLQPPPGKPANWWDIHVSASIKYIPYDPLGG